MLTALVCLFATHSNAQDLIPKEDPDTGKWGFVNKQGKVVIAYRYDYCVEFSDAFKNGYAVVRIDAGRGVIDRTGKEIIPCLYEKIAPLGENGFSVVSDNKMGYFDKSGKQTIPFEYSALAIGEEGFFGLSQGKWVKIEPEETKEE